MTSTVKPPAELVRSVLQAIDDTDLSVIETTIADDVYFRFGNAPATTTKAEFTAAAAAFIGSISSIRHRVLELWEEGERIVVLMDVDYERLDGGRLTLPCCNVFGVRDGKVHDYRVYMDLNPVYAP